MARSAALGPPDGARPLHWTDLDEFIQPKVEGLPADIRRRGPVIAAVAGVVRSLRAGTRARSGL